MKNIVLIPCWKRDDFLSVTLEYIRNANGADKNCYVFLVDRGYSPSVLSVVKSFDLCKEIHFTPFHRFHGNSYNILEGYRFAMSLVEQCQSKLVYLIEEDIWIGKDFYQVHELIQSNFDSFCVSACRNQNISTEPEKDPAGIFHHPSFQSLGISWKPEKLAQIVKHAKQEYYGNPAGYLQTQFPNSVKKRQHSEQDGLIFRVLEKENAQCIFTCVPRSAHYGFVGYNRKGLPLTGPLEERVKKLKSMTAEEMNSRAIEYKDITPINLATDYKVTEFKLIS